MSSHVLGRIYDPYSLVHILTTDSQPLMAFSALHALHAVIGTAIDDIERVYRERSQGAPVEFPSLDEPHYRIRAPSPRCTLRRVDMAMTSDQSDG